jgi:lysozyme
VEVFPEVRPSKEIIEFIKKKEGFREKAYKPLKGDTWTIGYGFTRIRGRAVRISDVITKEEADIELDRLLHEEYAKKLTPKFPIPQREFDAIISLAYNVGVYRLLNSVTWTLFKQGHDISERFTMWTKFDGKVIPGLLNRRKEELKIYKEGVYV